MRVKVKLKMKPYTEDFKAMSKMKFHLLSDPISIPASRSSMNILATCSINMSAFRMVRFQTEFLILMVQFNSTVPESQT
jgi:hypothetical protein